MTDILTTIQQATQWITLNRVEKHNAFDDVCLQELGAAIQEAEANPKIRVIVLNANGKHFSAGADLQWMQRMVHFSETENKQDAKILAETLYTLYHCTKPTIAMVQGSAYGGGAGLVAACDIAIAAEEAIFCFSEVKLGLIPAVISPYVVQAVGARVATSLFMSAEAIDAPRAKALHLIHHCVEREVLQSTTESLANAIAQWPPQAVMDAKSLVRTVADQPIDRTLQDLTASLIAKKRVSEEAQQAIQTFLNKKN